VGSGQEDDSGQEDVQRLVQEDVQRLVQEDVQRLVSLGLPVADPTAAC
jgi:hypothetical protein